MGKIGVIPLDDRPVCLDQVYLLAKAYGLDLISPPIEWLRHKHSAGHADRIGAWFVENFDQAETWIISLDMLCYGGLVASRRLDNPIDRVTSRLYLLQTAKQRTPHIPILAWQSVRRLSDTVTCSADLEKWAYQHQHATFDDRRARNHLVNLDVLNLVKDGTIEALSLLQEDCQPDGPHVEEHRLLIKRIESLGIEEKVTVTPGSDEGSAVLLARFYREFRRLSASVGICFSSQSGSERVALFEDRSIRKVVQGQCRAAGITGSEDLRKSDYLLMVWCPDAPTADLMMSEPVAIGEHGVTEFIQECKNYLAMGKQLSIADVRYANGGDPQLCDALTAAGLWLKLSGYSAWNTASNAIGFAIAQILLPPGNPVIAHRIIEDWAYQSVVRLRLSSYVSQTLQDDIWAISDTQLPKATRELNRLMQGWIEKKKAVNLHTMPVFRLPWDRTFEVCF